MKPDQLMAEQGRDRWGWTSDSSEWRGVEGGDQGKINTKRESKTHLEINLE